MVEYEFIGFLLFCIHIDHEFVLIHKAKKKKNKAKKKNIFSHTS